MVDAYAHPSPLRRPTAPKLERLLQRLSVGPIGRRAGVPVEVDQWGWSCGFYPGLEPGQHRSGSATTFDQARADFETVWAVLLPDIPAGAFDEYRRDREHRAEIRAFTPAVKICRATCHHRCCTGSAA